MYFLAGIVPLTLLLLITLILARIGWRAFARRRLPALPARPERAPLAARATDAIVYALVAIMLITLAGTRRNDGGYLLILGQVSWPLAVTVLAATAMALLLVLLATLLSLRGWATGAFVTGTAAVLGYAMFLESGAAKAFSLNRESILDKPFVISMEGPDVQGARLWINGVDLGTLPYRATMAEFRAKVPILDKPADYETDTVDHMLYSVTGSSYTAHEKRWIELSVPKTPWESATEPMRKYYARVQYAGEWALATGSGGAGSGGGGINYGYHSEVGAELPERQKRLDMLMNIARARDYHVDAEWFAAAETFRSDAYYAVLSARDAEPEMRDIWDAWAKVKYPVDSATSPEAAWALFERIAADADAAKRYDTATPQGHAVELLASRFPIDRLVKAAGKMLEQARNGYSYSSSTRYGPFQFATYEQVDDTGQNRATPIAYATAHAILAFHLAQQKAGVYPTDVQTRIVPLLLRYDPNGLLNVRAAAYFGGPVAVDYFLRNAAPVNIDRTQPGYRNEMSINAKTVNKWFYFASQMNDPEAREFRRWHQEELLKLAEQLTPTFGHERIGDYVDFLFEDPLLAARFWPKFSASLKTQNYKVLETSFAYLNRMKARPELYLDAWNTAGLTDMVDPISALSQLANIEDPALRQAVVAAFRTASLPRVDPRYRPRDEAEVRRQMNATLDAALEAAEHPEIDRASRNNLAILRQRKNPNYENIIKWLQGDAPAKLPALLAVDPDPQLRNLAARSLGALPTPGRRDLLAALAKDDDPTVRTSAETAIRTVEALRSAPLPTSEK